MTVQVTLTERQVQVAQGLSRHQTHKEIARDLCISTSAVAKHVAALKNALSANSHAEIVANFDALTGAAAPLGGVDKTPWQDNHLPQSPSRRAEAAADDPGLLRFADGADYPHFAGSVAIEWPGLNEPQVVPRWLDGRNATPARLAVIFGGIFAFVAALVLLISAVRSVSELVGGSEPDLALQNRSAS